MSAIILNPLFGGFYYCFPFPFSSIISTECSVKSLRYLRIFREQVNKLNKRGFPAGGHNLAANRFI